jgi:PKD repeat protein
MKNKLLTLIISLLSIGVGLAQTSVDKSNCREGENVEYCIQHKKIKELAIKNPALYAEYMQTREAEKANKTSSNLEKSGIVYTVPVVFHILHQGGDENISIAQIASAMTVLNRDFRRLNPDANTVQSPFIGMPADVEIEFRLATKAPNGACFSGITRTLTALTNNGSNGQSQVNAVVAGNDVFQGQWPPNRYLNVYICAEIGGAAGYTFNPGFGASSMYYNGIFVQHTYLGDIGTSSVFTSRTLTHEVGHWINLDHTWGGNNNPGNLASCSEDDNVSDTPICIGLQNCNLLANGCDDTNPAPGTSSSWGFNVVDNAENYMDYSYCSKMFTPGQSTRMRNALTSSTSGRNNLWTSNNLTFTGVGNLTLCRAEFAANKTIICAGEEVTFTDQTFNAVTGWTWSFPGGIPSTSAAQNPSITYPSSGVYQVSLVATDGSASDTETKTAFIKVLNNPVSLPFYESFESYTSLVANPNWGTFNPAGNAAFNITSDAAKTGTKSAKLTNFGQAAGNTDELISSAVDLSNASSNNITLSFRYAYRKRTSANFESLKVFFSGNCGTTWSQRKTLSGPLLGNVTAGTAWTPTSSDWVTVHIASVSFTSSFMNANFRYKFEFESDGGNNIFIDDINIYEGSESEEIVLSASNLEFGLNQLELFPNPSSSDVSVRFNIENNQEVGLVITDITGKIILTQSINAISGSNLVLLDAAAYAQGLYFITLKSGGIEQALEFIKQ